MTGPRKFLWSMMPAVLLMACATTPITVSPNSIPLMPSSSGSIAIAPRAIASSTASPQTLPSGGSQCAVYLADVRDIRIDPNDFGMLGARIVQTTDSVSWLNSALTTMKQDRQLRFVDKDADAQITLRIELVKAYIMAITTEKTSSVVLRAIYSRDGKDLDQQIMRGRDTGANWANGADEAQGSLNRALAAAVSQLDNDVVSHCHSATPAK